MLTLLLLSWFNIIVFYNCFKDSFTFLVFTVYDFYIMIVSMKYEIKTKLMKTDSNLQNIECKDEYYLRETG